MSAWASVWVSVLERNDTKERCNVRLCNFECTRACGSHGKQEDLADAANVTRHVLVYHRGYGLDKTRGIFAMEKVSSASQSCGARASA